MYHELVQKTAYVDITLDETKHTVRIAPKKYTISSTIVNHVLWSNDASISWTMSFGHGASVAGAVGVTGRLKGLVVVYRARKRK